MRGLPRKFFIIRSNDRVSIDNAIRIYPGTFAPRRLLLLIKVTTINAKTDITKVIGRDIPRKKFIDGIARSIAKSIAIIKIIIAKAFTILVTYIATVVINAMVTADIEGNIDQPIFWFNKKSIVKQTPETRIAKNQVDILYICSLSFLFRSKFLCALGMVWLKGFL